VKVFKEENPKTSKSNGKMAKFPVIIKKRKHEMLIK